jgi:hypothetical protein
VGTAAARAASRVPPLADAPWTARPPPPPPPPGAPPPPRLAGAQHESLPTVWGDVELAWQAPPGDAPPAGVLIVAHGARARRGARGAARLGARRPGSLRAAGAGRGAPQECKRRAARCC